MLTSSHELQEESRRPSVIIEDTALLGSTHSFHLDSLLWCTSCELGQMHNVSSSIIVSHGIAHCPLGKSCLTEWGGKHRGYIRNQNTQFGRKEELNSVVEGLLCLHGSILVLYKNSWLRLTAWVLQCFNVLLTNLSEIFSSLFFFF